VLLLFGYQQISEIFMKNIIKKELLPLFFIIAFPINTWSIYIFFYNFKWVAERTKAWDAIGYGAYALAFALFESLFVSLIITPVYLLLRKSYDKDTSVAILGITFLIISFWVIFGRVNTSRDTSATTFMFEMREKYNLRLRYLYPLFFLVIGAIAASMTLPPFLILKFTKLKNLVIEILKRLELLSYIYLIMNLISIVIVIIRNTASIGP